MARLFFPLLLALVVLCTYFGVLNQPFSAYDDGFHVTENAYYQPATMDRLWYFWRLPWDPTPPVGIPSEAGGILAPYRAIYAPLSFSTWGALTWVAVVVPEAGSVGGPTLDPSVFHSWSLLLHLASVLLLNQFLLRVIKNPWTAAGGALLFAVHPLQVESVAWITAMNNLLAGFWCLVALHSYLSYLEQSVAQAGRKGGRFVWYLAALCSFALALASKPTAVTLPVFALLVAWLVAGDTWPKVWRKRCLELLPWIALAAAVVLINQGLTRPDVSSEQVLWWQRPFLVGSSLAFYVGKLVWPLSLAVDYGRKASWMMSQAWFYLAWLIPVGVGLLIFVVVKRGLRSGNITPPLSRAVVTGAFGFLCTLLPASGVVTYYFHTTSVVADRYMYLALIPLSLCLAAGLQCQAKLPLSGRRKLALCLFGLLGLGWAGLAFKQVKVWEGERTFWSHTLYVNPRSSVTLTAMAQKLTRERQYVEAERLAQRGLQLAPRDWHLLTLHGQLLRVLHRPDAAIAAFSSALMLFPANVEALQGWGQTLEERGDYAGALEKYEAALGVNADLPVLLARYGYCAVQLGLQEQAQTALQRSLTLQENPLVRTYLAMSLEKQGKWAEARSNVQLAVGLDPSLHLAHYTLGLINEREGKNPAALAAYREALALVLTEQKYRTAVQRLKLKKP